MIIIRDNKESLVDIRKVCPKILVDIPEKILKRYGALVRKTVAKMLNRAQRNLPRGLRLLVGEAWRPAWYQKQIYEGFIKRFSKKYPKWSEKRVLEEVNKYVASWKGKYSSGHMSGGAVDVRIVDKNGRKIPMKSKKLTYQESAKTYNRNLPLYIKRNRQILINTMTQVGFSNYPKEFWHWSYGDYWWAKRNKRKVAIYGAVDLKNAENDY